MVEGNQTANETLGVIFTQSNDKHKSTIAGFKKTFWSSSAVVKIGGDMVCGSVGYFIGSIADAAATNKNTTVTLGGSATSTKANFFGTNSLVLGNTAVTDAYSEGALEFGRNTDDGTRTGKAFLGMQSVAFMNATTPTTVDKANAIGQLVGYSTSTNMAIDKIWGVTKLTNTGSTDITVDANLINKYAQ